MRTKLAPRESEVQRQVAVLYRGVGCQVLTFSEGRISRIPKGWPDMVVLAPLRTIYRATPSEAMWLHETKSATGKLSEAQEIMHDRLRLRGQRVLVGGEAEAREWLEQIGLLKGGA